MFRILFPLFILIIFQNNVSAEESLPPPLPTIKKAQAKKPKPQAEAPTPEEQKAEQPGQDSPQAKIDAATYQKVMSEYRDYLSTIPSKVRDEIKDYRKEIIRINKEKTLVYKQLSVEAQNFLKKEREFKRKLPMRQRKKITQASNAQ